MDYEAFIDGNPQDNMELEYINSAPAIVFKSSDFQKSNIDKSSSRDTYGRASGNYNKLS